MRHIFPTSSRRAVALVAVFSFAVGGAAILGTGGAAPVASGQEIPSVAEVPLGLAVLASGDAPEAFQVRGSRSTWDGEVRSGGGISVRGSDHRFLGPVASVTGVDVRGNATFDVEPTLGEAQLVPDYVTDFAPGGFEAAQWMFRGAYYDHTDDCTSEQWKINRSSPPLQPGVHWVPCDVQISGSNLDLEATLVASGRIRVSGNGFSLTPALGEHRALISGSTDPAAIDFSGSNTAVGGTSIAAQGGITVNGSHGVFDCGLWADTVTSGGSNHVVNGNNCVPIDSTPEECYEANAIVGTQGDDVLVGTEADDIICGLGGNDVIEGRDGSDTIYGGFGNDTVIGEGGDDYISGDGGDDNLNGGPGRDRIEAGAGNDMLDGGPDGDWLYGIEGDDSATGGAGDDYINGGDGSDTADGGADTDSCVENETETACERAQPNQLREGGITFPAEEVGPVTFTTASEFAGVAIEIDSAGGLTPFNVDIDLARRYATEPMATVLASVPVDITVPEDAPPFNSATLTLDYAPGLLDDFDPALLRIYNFDENAQLWRPVPGQQVVDVDAGTVTAELEHFSVYAVLKIATSSDWAKVFSQLPLRCVDNPDGTRTDLDVAFLIDQSGSMNTYDPLDRRVDAALAFLNVMADTDRATVIGFTTRSLSRAALLDVGPNRATLQTAIRQTGPAGGGTAFSPPVGLAISRLDNPDAVGRLRVIVLLTDGQGSYNTSLTTQAADAGIEIYTVGLGSGVDTALLTAMAEGTGGRFQQLASADDLPALYEQLAQDLVNNERDDDNDLIADCVERNGAFTPLINIDYGTGTAFSIGPSFITTMTPDPDSDDDLLIDGGELIATSLLDDPVLAEEYSYLVDQGLSTYYWFYSDPNDDDTDGDTIDDRSEYDNGLNPREYDDGIETDIEGLNYPPFTLFRHSLEPEPEPFTKLTLAQDGDNYVIGDIVYNDEPVRFTTSGRCVENCDPLIALAASLDNDNEWGKICTPLSRGVCVSEDEQISYLIADIASAQGIFAVTSFYYRGESIEVGGRTLSRQFVKEQAIIQCALWSGLLTECIDNVEDIDIGDIDVADRASAVNQAATIAIPIDGVGRPIRINPAWVGAVAGAAIATGAVIVVPKRITATRADIETALLACMASTAILQQFIATSPAKQACEVTPLYLIGTDVGASHDVRIAALALRPDRLVQRYASDAETLANKGVRRGWAAGNPGCTGADLTSAQVEYGPVPMACDEYPNYKMSGAGPGAYLEYVPFADNSLEGSRYGTFVTNAICGASITGPVPAKRLQFGVIPTPLPITMYSCGLNR